MDARRRSYWDLHDFSTGRGLEVGPLDKPLVTTAEGDVRYVDVHDREGLLRHYAGDPGVSADAIPEIDFHLIQADGRTRSLVEATAGGAPFDWVVASHVVEHVPDVIGWLAELAEVVVDDGVLVLAVPDRRFCFDAHRPATTVGQMIAAHRAGDRRPGVAAVHDHFAAAVEVDHERVWRGEQPTYADRLHTLQEAGQHAARSLAGDYVDCHVWLFSPDSFLAQLRELRLTGHSVWSVARMEPTPHGDMEFRVVLRRLPRGADATAAAVPGEVVSRSAMPDWVDDRARAGRVEDLERQLAELEARLTAQEAELERRTDALRRVRDRARRQRRELGRLGMAGRPAPDPLLARWRDVVARRLGRS